MSLRWLRCEIGPRGLVVRDAVLGTCRLSCLLRAAPSLGREDAFELLSQRLAVFLGLGTGSVTRRHLVSLTSPLQQSRQPWKSVKREKGDNKRKRQCFSLMISLPLWNAAALRQPDARISSNGNRISLATDQRAWNSVLRQTPLEGDMTLQRARSLLLTIRQTANAKDSSLRTFGQKHTGALRAKLGREQDDAEASKRYSSHIPICKRDVNRVPSSEDANIITGSCLHVSCGSPSPLRL